MKRACLQFTLLLQLILALILLGTAFTSIHGCYLVNAETNQCVDGPNRTFFGVSKGSSFHAVADALVFMMYAIIVMRWIYRDGGLAEDRFEIVITVGSLISLQALTLAAPWGSLSTTLDYLDCEHDPEKLPRDGATMLKCGSFESTAGAICVVSSLVFCTSTAIVSMVYMWDKDVMPMSTISSPGYESMSRRSVDEETNPPPRLATATTASTVVRNVGNSTGGGSRNYAQSIPGPFSNVNNRTINAAS